MFKVVINSRGFRGKEWAVEKPPGVFRIVTLGASSTFGFQSPEIRALYLTEAVPLHPDVVTFY